VTGFRKLRRWCEVMEAIEPTVRAILDDVVLRDDGAQFIDNFADWIVVLRERPRKENARVFIQLAVLARQFADVDCRSVAVCLAALARIGLPNARPRRSGGTEPSSGTRPVEIRRETVSGSRGHS
jgi:hypothetical protein